MSCPKCQNESKVIDSRQEFEIIKRRRECINCSHRWTTYEIHSDLCKSIIKKKANKYKSCSKCNRIAYAWKFCVEHLNEYKRLDMRARRDFWKQYGHKLPKKKKGPVKHD